jgi:hypothetical protein
MRTASILLAMVVVLGFVKEAGADAVPTRTPRGNEVPRLRVRLDNYMALIGGKQFGIADRGDPISREPAYTTLFAGPLGNYRVPFTATQGLVGFCLIMVALIASLTALTLRWKRKRAAS